MTATIQTATIVFTDLVGSTAMRSRLGDAKTEQLRHIHDTLTTDAIQAYGGEVVKSLGDGLMAVFASTSEAIHSADAIQRAFHRQNSQVSPDRAMNVRVGLAVGDVAAESGDYHGMPVVQAARVCDLCDTGEIVATTAVVLLAGSRVENNVVDLGSLELKGIQTPTPCVRIEWELDNALSSSIPLQSFLEGGTDTALRGRADEIAALETMWAAARGRRPQVALLRGEAGVGKTRLVAELASRVVRDGGVVLAGRVEEGLGGPYQPFVEAFEHYVRHRGTEAADTLGAGAGELTRIMPDLTATVGSLPDPIKADPGTEQYRLAAAIASFVVTVGESAPVLVVVDDFHWSSPQSALLLRHVCTHLDDARVMVAVTFRDTDLPANADAAGVIADLFRAPHVHQLTVQGISQAAIQQLITDLGIESATDNEKLAAALQTQAEGNPFFVTELLRHAADRPDGTGVQALSLGTLPASVTEVVHRRLSRLEPVTVEILTFAAITGREFTVKLLGQVLGDQVAVIDATDEATTARLLEERGTGRFRFVHQLVADTLVGDITATRRATMHLRLANAIERDNAADIEGVIGELAHHYWLASPVADVDQTIDVLTRAGAKATRQLAFSEAAEFFARALELVDDSRAATRIDLLVALARARTHAGRPDRASVVEALGLAEKIGDNQRIAESVLAEDVTVLGAFGAVDTTRTAMLERAIERSNDLPVGLHARLLAELALELVFGETLERRLAIANRALDLARSSREPETLARVLALRYPTLWNARTLQERLAIVGELESLLETLDDASIEFNASANGALVGMEAGDLSAADERLATAERLADQLGEPRLKWFAGLCRAKRLIIAGDLSAADRLAVDSAVQAELAGRADGANYLAAQKFCIGFLGGELAGLRDDVELAVSRSGGRRPFRAMRAALNAEIGNLDASRDELEQLSSDEFDFPANFTEVVGLCFCALSATATRHTDAAATLYDRLLPHRGRFADAGSTWYGAIDYYLGDLAHTLDRFEDAATHYAEAQRLHTGVGCRPMEARTADAITRLPAS